VSEHSILILANGQQTRFGPAETPKQLVMVDGERLLDRTLRLFGGTIIAWNPVIQSVGKFCDIGQTAGLQETMLKALHLWGEKRTTFLFGDCYYSDAAAQTILDCSLPYAHICRTHHSEITGKPYGETFAISWAASMNEAVLAELPKGGTSWQLYRRMAGIEELPEDVNYLELSPRCLIRIDDETDDFDSIEDYERWLARCRATS
jgi:hypothetical protein